VSPYREAVEREEPVRIDRSEAWRLVLVAAPIGLYFALGCRAIRDGDSNAPIYWGAFVVFCFSVWRRVRTLRPARGGRS
jgi:hypothetical protein